MKADRKIKTYRHIHGNHRKPDECTHVHPLAALRSIAKSENEAHDEETEVEVVDNEVENLDPPSDVE